MPAQLDALGGEMLCRQIERYGIFVRTGKDRRGRLRSRERVLEGLVLDDGATLPTDMVVLACGVRPRVDLARASGLPVNKGIIVNDTLATEVPGVYAFGECAEHAGKTYGLVAPAWEQAAVLADVLTGANPQARYRGSKLYARLKVAGVDVASMGCKGPELEGDEVLQILEERRNSYRKLIVRGGRLVGAMLVGNTAASGSLVQLFDRGDPLPDDPLEVFCHRATCRVCEGPPRLQLPQGQPVDDPRGDRRRGLTPSTPSGSRRRRAPDAAPARASSRSCCRARSRRPFLPSRRRADERSFAAVSRAPVGELESPPMACVAIPGTAQCHRRVTTNGTPVVCATMRQYVHRQHVHSKVAGLHRPVRASLARPGDLWQVATHAILSQRWRCAGSSGVCCAFIHRAGVAIHTSDDPWTQTSAG